MVYKKGSVLIVDDEKAIRELVSDELCERGYVCTTAVDGDDALVKLMADNFDVALLDIKLPGTSGLDLLKAIRSEYPKTAVVMVTVVADIDTVVETIRLGASDFIVKPFTLDRVRISISKALENRQLSSREKVDGTEGNIDVRWHRGRTDRRAHREMDAIAYGVDAQVDYFDFHSQLVTQRAVDVARQLGIPETDIEQWVIARKRLFEERERRINSILSKLERNPLAQIVLGLTCLPFHTERRNNNQN